MKLQNLQEAKYHQAGTFDALMLNYFTKYGADEDEDSFNHIWTPKPDTFPWYKETDIRGAKYSVDEQISYIAQGAHNETDVWVEYELDRGNNGDWMNKKHAMQHIIILDETGKKVYP